MGFKDIYREAETLVARTSLIEPDLIGIQIDVPESLKRIFIAEGAINKHLIPKFKEAIANAVTLSFNHPDTKPAGAIRQSDVKWRIDTCFEAAEVAYYEMGLGMIALCDMMPHVLVSALRSHFHGESGAPAVTSEYATKNPQRWGLPHEDTHVIPTLTHGRDGHPTGLDATSNLLGAPQPAEIPEEIAETAGDEAEADSSRSELVLAKG